MRKGRLKSALLCVGLVILCMAGCGSAGNSAVAGEDAHADESTKASDGARTEEEIAADGTNADEITPAVTAVDGQDGSDTQNENGQIEPEDAEDEVTFEGLALSILGDSISTYDGWIPEGCAVYYPMSGMLTDVSQTWWMRLLDDTGMELCSNGSSSGSTCVGDSLSIDEPKYGCSDYRISLLTGQQGKMPDIIIVYMGTNDLLMGKPIGDNDGTEFVEEGMIGDFSDGYTMMLDKLESHYPAAQIYCCTLVQVGTWGTKQPFITLTNNLGLTAEDYSKQIEKIAQNRGLPVIDLYHCGIEIDNLSECTSDGVHMTPDGMKYIEQAMLSAMGFALDE